MVVELARPGTSPCQSLRAAQRRASTFPSQHSSWETTVRSLSTRMIEVDAGGSAKALPAVEVVVLRT